MIRDFRTLTYEDRLEKCGLTKLDKRRHRGRLIAAYRLVTSKEATTFFRLFKLANRSGLGEHRYTGQVSFSSRVVKDWNELRDEAVSVGTIETS